MRCIMPLVVCSLIKEGQEELEARSQGINTHNVPKRIWSKMKFMCNGGPLDGTSNSIGTFLIKNNLCGVRMTELPNNTFLGI